MKRFIIIKKLMILGFFAVAVISCNKESSTANPPVAADDTQYLIFQFFTYNPSSDGYTQPFDSVAIHNQVKEILSAVDNNRGDGNARQLGFAIGPLSLDHTDDELRMMIRQSFKIAAEENVAVAFHIDDSMFWINRKYLWNRPGNIEWSDWDGTVIPHRYIDWAPVVLAPQMCYNSPLVKQEIQRIARDVIGAEIKKGIDGLTAAHKELLFAGVIAGWETHLADVRYVDTSDRAANTLGIKRVQSGYNALTNIGYSAANPPSNFDSLLERVVHDYADFWAIQLGQANIPANRIYTHISFPVFPPGQQQAMLNQLSLHIGFTANMLGFTHTNAGTAFNGHSRPGFSTYPAGFKENGVDGGLSKILQEFPNHAATHWASAEGTNVQVGTNGSGISWHDYLAGMFNNGASVVNIYAWSNPSVYGIATRSTEAIAAYKKFLTEGF